jgi:hypothetical protein
MDIMLLLNIVIRAVLAPRRLYPQHLECFRLLTQVCEGFKSQEHLPNVQDLLEAIKRHHAMFVTLYEAAIKPKLHYLFHCWDSMSEHQVQLNCFPTERRHRLSKRVGQQAYKEFHLTMMSRNTSSTLEDLKKPDVYSQVQLMENTAPAPHSLGLPVSEDWLRARSIRTPRGRVHAGDMARFRMPGGIVVGMVQHCLSNGDQHLLAIDQYTAGRQNKFTPTGRMRCYPISALVDTLPYLSDDGAVRLYL